MTPKTHSAGLSILQPNDLNFHFNTVANKLTDIILLGAILDILIQKLAAFPILHWKNEGGIDFLYLITNPLVAMVFHCTC